MINLNFYLGDGMKLSAGFTLVSYYPQAIIYPRDRRQAIDR